MPALMRASFQALPEDTMVYCAHEYTESNANFATTVNPNNEALLERAAEIKRMRAQVCILRHLQ